MLGVTCIFFPSYSVETFLWITRTFQVEEGRLKVTMSYFKFSLESSKDSFSFIII